MSFFLFYPSFFFPGGNLVRPGRAYFVTFPTVFQFCFCCNAAGITKLLFISKYLIWKIKKILKEKFLWRKKITQPEISVWRKMFYPILPSLYSGWLLSFGVAVCGRVGWEESRTWTVKEPVMGDVLIWLQIKQEHHPRSYPLFSTQPLVSTRTFSSWPAYFSFLEHWNRNFLQHIFSSFSYTLEALGLFWPLVREHLVFWRFHNLSIIPIPQFLSSKRSPPNSSITMFGKLGWPSQVPTWDIGGKPKNNSSCCSHISSITVLGSQHYLHALPLLVHLVIFQQ